MPETLIKYIEFGFSWVCVLALFIGVINHYFKKKESYDINKSNNENNKNAERRSGENNGR